jgi:hypothetical protein
MSTWSSYIVYSNLLQLLTLHSRACSGIVDNVKGAVGGTFEAAKGGAMNIKEKVFGK